MMKSEMDGVVDSHVPSTSFKVPPLSAESPFRVLGVALVVDQRGSGARLVARYPTQPSKPHSVASTTNNGDETPPSDGNAHNPLHTNDQPNHSAANSNNHGDDGDEDLFFTLPARQMAKLFRTKKTLCGVPMTLTVNGTVFCCRAVLLQGDDSPPTAASATGSTTNTPQSDDATANTDTSTQSNQLDLFSVIIAMSAPTNYTSVPFSSWLENSSTTEDQLEIQRYIREATAAATSNSENAEYGPPRETKMDSNLKQRDKKTKNRSGSVSSEFLSIRRVHLSLARYCRALEREERRCQYISLQAEQMFKIRTERQKVWDEQRTAGMASTRPNKLGAGTTSSSSSVGSSKVTQPTSGDRRSLHGRSSSFSANPAVEDLTAAIIHQDVVNSIKDEREREQEILELMLAASPANPTVPGIPKHHGNLVRELVQVFHSISRNDYLYPQTPLALLIERDGVVYVNQHIAIPMEAASPKPAQTTDSYAVRPYYTLLFPHASPSGLLQAFQSSGSAPPLRLQQLLLTVNAQKPLTDIAIDANLPLRTTLEVASHLVQHGACVMSPVVSRQSRLACLQVDRISDICLEFSQLFPKIHIFRLVSFVTSVKTLGEAMSILTNMENEEGAWLRGCLSSPAVARPENNSNLSFSAEEISPRVNTGKAPMSQDGSARWEEGLEEQLYAMVVWLLSHRILTQLQDYCVVVGTEHDDVAPPVENSASGTGAATTAMRSTHSIDADENLFRELLSLNFLNGNISIMAISWRLGLEPQKVRAWGLRHRRIRVISRIPKPGDDWDPNLGETP